MHLAILAALQAFFMWAWPRIAALFATAVISDQVSGPFMEGIHNLIDQRLSGLSAIAANFVTYTGLPEAIGILFTAYGTVIAIKFMKLTYKTQMRGF